MAFGFAYFHFWPWPILKIKVKVLPISPGNISQMVTDVIVIPNKQKVAYVKVMHVWIVNISQTIKDSDNITVAVR